MRSSGWLWIARRIANDVCMYALVALQAKQLLCGLEELVLQTRPRDTEGTMCSVPNTRTLPLLVAMRREGERRTTCRTNDFIVFRERSLKPLNDSRGLHPRFRRVWQYLIIRAYVEGPLYWNEGVRLAGSRISPLLDWKAVHHRLLLGS
jgi:hypothetical protein